MKNIVLIGFMGTGKSTIGKLLEKSTNLKFIDTDLLIEKRTKMSISEIFKKYGENHFRKLENKITNELGDRKGLIISTGGGIILDEENIMNLKKNGLIFLLDGSVKTIIKNLKRSYIERPLLKNEDWREEVENLLRQREELYKKSGDYIINVDNKIPKEICLNIIKIYKNTDSFYSK